MKLSPVEQKVFELLEKIAQTLGLEIVKVKFSGSNRKVLDIAIDRLDGESVTIKDCRLASNNFSEILDTEEDLISGNYSLEVGSAGVERPLIKESDYNRFTGKVALVKLHHAQDESKKFEGEILGFADGKINLKLKGGKIVEFEFSNIKGANLVYTEEMFRNSLSKNKE